MQKLRMPKVALTATILYIGYLTYQITNTQVSVVPGWHTILISETAIVSILGLEVILFLLIIYACWSFNLAKRIIILGIVDLLVTIAFTVMMLTPYLIYQFEFDSSDIDRSVAIINRYKLIRLLGTIVFIIIQLMFLYFIVQDYLTKRKAK